ncbi:MAG: hypothetical protein RLZZ618_3665 [Pseudomonadota bacterium]
MMYEALSSARTDWVSSTTLSTIVTVRAAMAEAITPCIAPPIRKLSQALNRKVVGFHMAHGIMIGANNTARVVCTLDNTITPDAMTPAASNSNADTYRISAPIMSSATVLIA